MEVTGSDVTIDSSWLRVQALQDTEIETLGQLSVSALRDVVYRGDSTVVRADGFIQLETTGADSSVLIESNSDMNLSGASATVKAAEVISFDSSATTLKGNSISVIHVID